MSTLWTAEVIIPAPAVNLSGYDNSLCNVVERLTGCRNSVGAALSIQWALQLHDYGASLYTGPPASVAASTKLVIPAAARSYE